MILHRLLLLLALCGSLMASGAGKSWGVERRVYVDPVTGYHIQEVTAEVQADFR
ncbi:MAG: hypothetical protein NTY38_14045 [Acidobacteria bacterium]|nr:hypothetical protein [Acidobacteriota bacterium]